MSNKDGKEKAYSDGREEEIVDLPTPTETSTAPATPRASSSTTAPKRKFPLYPPPLPKKRVIRTQSSDGVRSSLPKKTKSNEPASSSNPESPTGPAETPEIAPPPPTAAAPTRKIPRHPPPLPSSMRTRRSPPPDPNLPASYFKLSNPDRSRSQSATCFIPRAATESTSKTVQLESGQSTSRGSARDDHDDRRPDPEQWARSPSPAPQDRSPSPEVVYCERQGPSSSVELYPHAQKKQIEDQDDDVVVLEEDTLGEKIKQARRDPYFGPQSERVLNMLEKLKGKEIPKEVQDTIDELFGPRGRDFERTLLRLNDQRRDELGLCPEVDEL